MLLNVEFLGSIPLNIDLRKRPGELSNEDYYNIAINYEKLFC